MFLPQDPSGGQFIQSYIPVSGTIMAVENVSPQVNIAMDNHQNDFPQATTQQLRKQLPAMQRWSDIVWYVWALTAKDKAGDLRYIFRDHVIDQIFKVPAYTLDFKWPGKTFDVGTDDRKALLGTPHGTGIAYLLADNKKTLGKRSLKITCFTSDSFREKVTDYFMLFELVRV
ncbi:MAG: hypothetical protein L6R38_007485 [Xanthoria sp. 2 TBL-2021]|nr:MAG: hypothetical protein L6R38_007485 [Xanthoria sp. 2 TBL-2021]